MIISELAINSELALASYANLKLGDNVESDFRSNNSGVFSSLAASLADRYRVIAILDDTASGAYAAVFEDKLTGERTLAIRGTTDINDIVADTYLLTGTPASLNPQYAALAARVMQWQAEGIVGASTTVVGHSLGGYLATALKSSADFTLGLAYTFNAPGLGSAAGTLGEFFQGAFNIGVLSSAVYDVRGSAGLSLIAGLGQHWGAAVPVEIEAAAGAGLGNHLIDKLTSSLAVMRMWSALDPTLTVDRANQLIAAASDTSASSLEKSVEATLRLLNGPNLAATIATGDVDALYANLIALTAQNANGTYTNPAFSTLAGQVRIELSSAELANSARGDFSSLVSLIGLSPLVLSGADAAGQAALDGVLQGAWGDEFAQWQADREAVAAGLAASHHTDAWLSDRALLLQTVLGFNVSGEVSLAGLPTDRVMEFQWRDADNAARTLLAGGLIDEALVYFDRLPVQRLAFGGDAAEVLTGTDNELGDHLYAGGGNDTVQGLLGSDWLEGNAGDDRLDGGLGYDWLDGGAGADTLEGGEGLYYDTLEGGAGDDLYLVGANAGIDNITSSEAGDRLELNGRRIDGSGTLIAITDAVTIWQDRSEPGEAITYSLNAATHELSIRGANSTVVVKDFEASDLGISVPGDAAGAAAGTTVFADLSSGDYSGGWRDGGFDAPAGSAEHLINFNQAQPLAVPAFFTIDTRGGDDWIEGGAGISGVPLHITAGSGNDRIYAGLTQTLTQALATQDTVAASGRSDLLLDGGAGDDSVFGGASDDALFGGDGDDTLVGGAGRDVIFSDGDSGQKLAGWREGLTNQRWVAGDNTSGATLYFNGAARFGRIAYFSTGSAIEVTSETQFYNLKFGPDSIDFTPLSALQGVRLAPADYLPGWTVRNDGRFDGSDSQLGSHDPQPGLYFNTNRYSGRDVVFAGAGNDLVNAGGGDDYVDAGSGNDVVRGYQGDDQIIGGTGNDNLLGDSYSVDSRPADVYLGAEYRTFVLDPARPGQAHGNDFIDGGDGNDTLEGNGGADVLWGGRGNDLIFGDESRLPGAGMSSGDCIGNDVIDGGEGNDTALGGGGDDFISAGLGADTLFADNAFSDNLPYAGRSTAAGHDTLDGGAGNDSIFGEGGNDVLLGGDGNDQLEGDGATTLLRSALHGNDDIDGGAGNDSLWGGGGADVLRGGDGNDWLAGEDQRTTSASTTLFGHDILWGGAGGDTLLGGTGDDQLSGGADADMLYGGYGADTYLYNLGDGFDTIVDLGGYNDGADELRLGAGISADNLSLLRTGSDLVFTFDHAGDQLTLKNWVLGPSSGYQIEMIRFADGTVWSEAETSDAAQQTRGTAGNDVLRGSDLYRDRVRGLGGNDTLSGSGYGDTLDGGDGDDLLDAGGNGSLNREITYIGGKGNDTLIGSEYGDVYIFNLGDGVDTLIDHADYASDGEDELRFGAGIVSGDMTLSRLGDDMVFKHANGSDQITVVNWFADPYRRDQIDRIVFEDVTWSADDASLSGQPPVVGTPGDDRLIGTTTPERIIGGAGNDTLTAEGGHDQLEGGDGDDVLNTARMDSYLTYYSGVTFIGGRGNDTIEGSDFDDLYIFNLGDGADIVIDDSIGPDANVLRFGADVGAGDITPVRSGLDVVFQHANGTDRVTVKNWFTGKMNLRSLEPIDYYNLGAVQFSDGTNWTANEVTERLRYPSATGTSGADFLLGTEASDTLLGLAGDDLLMARRSGDRLEGGTGNDILMAMADSAAVTFVGGAGNDTVTGSQGHDLYLFNLGDGADTVTVTNRGSGPVGSILRFGAGIAPRDMTTLRAGNDLVLRHRNGADQVTIKSWFADAASSYQTEFVEFANGTRWSADFLTQRLLRLSGTAGADALVGTAFVDTLLGLAGDDTLTAVGHNDVLDGGAGNDALITLVTDYKFSNGYITFTGGRGNDTFFSWQSLNDLYHFKLGDGADTITDFDEAASYNAADELRFGTGIVAADISALRAGNDMVLRHTNRTDQITITDWFTDVTMQIEQVSFIDGTVWLADQISQRALATGTPGDDLLTGTELADLIEGLAGNDTLDGGAGNDTLIGGTGDDTYVVDSAFDVLTEKASQGTDTVQSSLSWTLGANLENLTLTGTEASSGTGNTLANALRGNAQANLLSGLGGNDTLYGGVGADTLLGGAGDDSYIGGLGADTLNDTSTTANDVYVWGRDQGADTLSDAGGIDRLDVLPGVTEDQLWLRRVGKNLELSVIGTADSLTINGWYASPGKQIESFHLSDGQALQAGRVQQLVDAMAAFAPPSAGQTSLPQPYQTALQPMIAPNWV
jgi:Ca2+-binding RTX toxin-like protein